MDHGETDKPIEPQDFGSDHNAYALPDAEYDGVYEDGDQTEPDIEDDVPQRDANVEILAECDPIYLQFRGEQPAMPMVRTTEQLQAAIDVRCKPGLEALTEAHGENPEVEYAGYALAVYMPPTERFDSQHPEVAEGLKLALVGVSAEIVTGPQPDPQDYWLGLGDCFDIQALARETPEVLRPPVWRQEAFASHGFILGPVVRFRTEDFASNDEYNQRSDLAFDPNKAVYIPGEVLLDALQQDDPRLLEGFGIERGAPAEYLTRAFGLEPTNERYREEWTARRRAWEAGQQQ